MGVGSFGRRHWPAPPPSPPSQNRLDESLPEGRVWLTEIGITALVMDA